ncbi:MAG: GerMN domain-containing protein [Treponema sp.]
MHYITKTCVICWILLAGIAIALTATYVGSQSDRLLLYFEDDAGTIGTEVRYVPRDPQKTLGETVLTELLLGPVDRRFLKLADPSIVPYSCFLRNGTLYIDLPEEILFQPETSSGSYAKKNLDFKTVYQLIKKNIFTNCKEVRAVYISICGRPVYADSY